MSVTSEPATLPTPDVEMTSTERLLQMFDAPDIPDPAIDPRAQRAQIRNALLVTSAVLTMMAISPAASAVTDTLAASNAKAVFAERTADARYSAHLGADKKSASLFNKTLDGLTDALPAAVREPAIIGLADARTALDASLSTRSIKGVFAARAAVASQLTVAASNAVERAAASAAALNLADPAARDAVRVAAESLSAATPEGIPEAMRQVALAQNALSVSQSAAIDSARKAAQARVAGKLRADIKAASAKVSDVKAQNDKALIAAVTAATTAAQTAADQRAHDLLKAKASAAPTPAAHYLP